jgi:undecaprenyl-diphosphatase
VAVLEPKRTQNLDGAGLLLVARRLWGAVFFLAASIAGALVVQLLKGIFGRVRPEEMLGPHA